MPYPSPLHTAREAGQKVPALTMIMMAASTFAVGFLPTYAAAGFAAPLLLLVQGFSTGGEYAGATTYIAEYAPDKRRGFLGSWLDFGTFVGQLEVTPAGAALRAGGGPVHVKAIPALRRPGQPRPPAR